MGAKLTKAQRETLAVMDSPDTGYSSASVAHKRRKVFGSIVYTGGQRAVMMRLRQLRLVAMVADYSGDLWANISPSRPDAGRLALKESNHA